MTLSTESRPAVRRARGGVARTRRVAYGGAPPPRGPRRARGREAPPRRVRGWFASDTPSVRRRGLCLLLVFSVAAAILATRLVAVQLVDGPRLARLAAAEHQVSVVLPAQRGDIIDSTGRLLAGDVTVYDVFADPGLIPPAVRQQDAAALAPVLGLGPGRIAALLAQPGRFVYLAHAVPDSERSAIVALGLDGIGTIGVPQRVYNPSPVPGISFASAALGFVNHDGNGQYGVEQRYDGVLAGTAGSESVVSDDNGNPIVLSDARLKAPHDGATLQLGLDSQVQYWAEEEIAHGVQDDQAASGCLIVMDTHSGAIRAMAQFPSFDGNQYAGANLADITDNCTSSLYEPGSVMKTVTFAGGLDHRAITPDTQMVEGPVTMDGFTIRDWDNRAHGLVSMQQVLDQSLNDGAIKVQQLTGQDAFFKNMLAFGIGSPTGVDVSGEASQALPPQSQWKPLNYATAAFGQGVEVTPLQMAAAVNTIADGGVWVQPHMVDAVIDPATGARTPFHPQTRQVISPPTATTLSTMMVGVVDNRDGEGFDARIPAFKGEVAGKTGTASVAVNGTYGGDVVASFAGFLPARNPQFTMFVVLRNPQENRVQRFGAFLAAPIWKDMAQLLIDHWHITP